MATPIQPSDAVSEQNYKQLFAQAPAPIAIYKGRELRYVFVNDAYSKIFNNRAILNKTVREAFPELQGQGYYEILEAVYDSGNPYYAKETPALIDVNNDGHLTTRCYNLVYTPFKNGEGIIEGVMAFGNDITDQVEARKKVDEIREELEYSNQLIKTITDNATSTLFMMNAKGYCTFMNAAGEKMFGFTQSEIRVKPLHYLIHHHRPDGSFYPMEECPIDRALPENFDVRAHHDLFFRKDGSFLHVTCAASPIFEEGVPVSTVIEVRDISLEKKAEQTLRRSAAELEQLVMDRTLDLKRANEQLQQFSYAASHDLQEPLRKIGFFLQRLLLKIGPSLDDQDRKNVERIESTLHRMRGLIHDLLDYSNATLGITAFEAVNPNTIINEVLGDMEATVVEKGAKIEVPQLPLLKGDKKQLRQLFHNLLSNAFKYQKPGKNPEVSIKHRMLAGKEADIVLPAAKMNKSYHEIEISDNGIGFSQENADRIFEIFQRLHGKGEFEGTGVGLAIVKKVVENHDGFTWAGSTPGEGSTFTILLPSD